MRHSSSLVIMSRQSFVFKVRHKSLPESLIFTWCSRLLTLCHTKLNLLKRLYAYTLVQRQIYMDYYSVVYLNLEPKPFSMAPSANKANTHTRTYKYLYISSSSSSCRAGSTDIPDPLSPLFPIVHRLWYYLPLVGLLDYIPHPHIVAECMFVLVVLLLLGHMSGSIRVHHLWVRPCFSSSVLHVWFV